MALTHARTQVWLTDDGEIDHVTHHHYNPATSQDGSHYAEGATATEMRSSIDEVAQGLRPADVHDLETLSAIVASLHLEHVEAGVRNAAREEHKQALEAMVDEHASTLAGGTGATLDDVHARAMTLRAHIRARAAHVKTMTELHCKEHCERLLAEMTAEIQDARHRMTADLHAAIDEELAPKRAEHDALTKGDTKAMIEALRAQVAKHEETIAELRAPAEAKADDAVAIEKASSK